MGVVVDGQNIGNRLVVTETPVTGLTNKSQHSRLRGDLTQELSNSKGRKLRGGNLTTNQVSLEVQGSLGLGGDGLVGVRGIIYVTETQCSGVDGDVTSLTINSLDRCLGEHQ